MYRIIYLQAAKKELYAMGDYYKAKFGNESAGEVVKAIQTVINRLSMFPESGSFTPDQELNEQGYRMVIAGKHAAIFRLVETYVYVYHMFDTRMDYRKLFEEKKGTNNDRF